MVKVRRRVVSVISDVAREMFPGLGSREKLFFLECPMKLLSRLSPKIKLLCDISNCIILEDHIKYLDE